jgi:nuclear pore complex protein Nup62
VSAAQNELNSNLELIFGQQKDLESVLVQLEGEVEKLSLTADFTPQDRERERGYQMAEQMNGQLDHMSNTLKDLVRRLNDAQSNGDNASDPVSQIVQILNAHLNSLQWIEQNAAVVQQRIQDVQRTFNAAQGDHERMYRFRKGDGYD